MKVTGLFLCALSVTIATSQAFNLATQAFNLVASLQSQLFAMGRYIKSLTSELMSLNSTVSKQLTASEEQITSLNSKLGNTKKALAYMVDIFWSTCAGPVAHVYGRYLGRYSNGTVHRWTSYDSSAILSGGITLSSDGSSLTVPAAGVYYIYGQLMLDPTSGDSSECAFGLRVNSQIVASSYTYGSKSGSVDHTKYTGVIRPLNKGDNITMQMQSTCTLNNFHHGESFLGLIFFTFSFSDISNSAAMTYGLYSGTYSSGTLSQWGNYTFNINQGGALYNSSGITAGTSGLYFVFGQLQFDPQSTPRCGFKLEIGSRTLSQLHIDPIGGAFDRTEYTGLVTKMSSGERLQMTSIRSCNFTNHFSYGSFIGVFYLPFQTEPAVHLLGFKGETLRTWGSPTINIGNVLYSSSGFTVPKRGIYYVYVQLEIDPRSGSPSQRNCGYELRTERKIIAAAHYWRPNPNSYDRVTYTGAAALLNGGDTVSVRMKGTCYLQGENIYVGFLGGFYLRS
ncbi:uncharacterized protein [Oscarella lobularis]|uniref:uncharacterized protein isoform X2 n=1 Tax=Oscarella lobularis TaxID=121494 RepID=UPI0033142B63